MFFSFGVCFGNERGMGIWVVACGEMVKGKNGWKLSFIFENQRWSELGREAVYKAPRNWF